MRLSRGSPAIWFATIARQTSANAIGSSGNPPARNAALYPRERRSAIVPIVFALVCLAIVLNQIAGDPRESLIGLGLVAIGLPVYYFWSRTHARD